MPADQLQQMIRALPPHPGVYRYYDQDGRLLYIGKAINLKRRVSSYFQKPQTDPRIHDLVGSIYRLEFTVTDSAVEALLLEAYLINSHQPPYNILLKDDKTFVTILITKELFPRVLIRRPTQKHTEPILYQFGPYPSADAARIALSITRKIFPFRTKCAYNPHKLPGRGCLDYQLGLCPGSCAQAIGPKEYRKILNKLVLFLQGKKLEVLRMLTREMKTAARAHQFEHAAMIRDQIHALTHIQDVALMRRTIFDQGTTEISNDTASLLRRIEAYDISNIMASYAVASMVVIENGKPDKAGYRKFRMKTVPGQNDLQMMEEVLTRRFRHLEWPLPSLILLDGGANHLKIGKRVLNHYRLSIPLVATAKGPDRKNLDLYPSDRQLLPELGHNEQTLRLARDEAHRFAITFHRSVRDKSFLDD